MTSRVVRDGPGAEFPGRLKEIVISCDNMSCTVSVNDEQIRAGGGLRKMGWEPAFMEHKMRHYCPAHNRSKGVKD